MKTRKFTALLLVLCMLLTAVPYSAPVRAAEEEHLAQEQTQTQTETQEQTQVTSETAAETTTAPLAEGIFFQFVDQAVFQANGHVARVPEEETLSTYVFRNSDGTKTVYYLPDNVKYIAEDGAMIDKDLTLVSQAGGYGVKRSDIQYLLPTSAASGIRMTHGNKQVTMYPQAPLGRATAATVSGDSVRYDNYFGSGIHLVYTPIPSGLKEDIVLDSYTGTSSFSFTIDTNGMRLYNDEGQYYFAASADAEEKIYLGDIIVYDAKGEPSAGTLTVTPVTMGQQYTLTVSADPAFLTSPDTVYPVTIDPTLTVSAATNSSFIEDATIYQNKPTTNAGNWTYNHCGYYASANTDYGVCRTAIRLAGLKNNSTWQSMSYSNIVSAKFYIKEATGTAGVRFTLHNITNTTWTEANATWNSLANAYSTTVSGEASPAYGGVAEFDFTALAKSWKSSNSTADCSFMLISSNTTVDKAFYSAEYGTPSYRPYVTITYNANTNGLNYTTKSVDEGSTFQLSWPGVSSQITWTSSNTTIATVSASGLVTGLKAGTATIAASANGYTSATCTVTVTLPYGIYYINASNGISIGTGGTQTNLAQVMTYPKITSGTSKYYQLWEIKHISNGKYSIRSIGNGSLILYRYNTNAVVYNSDPHGSVPSQGLWKIEYAPNGYKLLNNGSSSYALTVNGSDTSSGQFVKTMNYSSSSAQMHWELEIVKGVFLLDAETRTILPLKTVLYLELNTAKSLGELGILAVKSGTTGTGQSIRWQSSNGDIATVNELNGSVSTIGLGKTTISATIAIDGITYSYCYDVHVVKFYDAIPIYDNAYTVRYSGQQENAPERIMSLMDDLQEFYLDQFNVMITYESPTQFESYADSCNTLSKGFCDCGTCFNSMAQIEGITVTLTLCPYHHTNATNNLLRITFPDSTNTVKIAFIGHEACDYVYGGCTDIFGLCYAELGLLSVHHHTSRVDEFHTLIHEFGHLFDAPDHYADGCPSTSDMNNGNQGPQFSPRCIYGEDNHELASIIICDGCKARITENIDGLS